MTEILGSRSASLGREVSILPEGKGLHGKVIITKLNFRGVSLWGQLRHLKDLCGIGIGRLSPWGQEI